MFGNRHEELFTVNDLYRFTCLTSGEKGLLKDLANKILYVGNFDGFEKITDMYRARASKEETSALNTVAKALKAVPIRAVRDFQRRKFGTPPTLLGSHYNQQTHCFTSSNSSVTRIS